MSAPIRFGVYELDRDAAELRKHGVPMRLQQQPLRVLVMLTEPPGNRQPRTIAGAYLGHDDKPQFSADGNTLYFTSTRDGYLCIWAQRLNPATKHPLGPPFAFEHFHNSIGRDAVSNQTSHDLSVGGDRLLMDLSQWHPQVWLTQIP